ncbi:MAG: rane-bound metal-dependent hydrolase [Paenibacillaceae bacterium]|jgi:inner membrane protein|nr:rane-bound metal-dependent hydrolase [Paenibacillaceae bacterium]
MDTGTHLVFGLGLAGLAHIDPVVAQNTTVAAAVLFGTLLGQQAPDLDTLFRMKSNALYIRQHRGASHSLPAILLWALSITAGIGLIVPGLPLWHVGFWVLLAVMVHVGSDMFNTYGTQAVRPFTEKWVSWNIIHIFDPFLFGSHVIAISLWAAGIGRPQVIFPVLYTLIALYYCWRSLHHFLLERGLSVKDPDFRTGDKYFLIPTVSLHAWNVVKRRSDNTYAIGDYKQNKLQWLDNVSCDCHPAVDASKAHPDIAAFLYFSSFACAELKQHSWGYEVRWADVRYRHRKQYPFVAALLLDNDLNPIDSYVGWLSESRLYKKLRLNAP